MQNPLAQLPKKKHTELPKVAIVGRTNVGKSSLFNRMVGKRQAIVQPEHGTTIDRIASVVRKESLNFQLIDTGGFSFSKPVPFRDEINRGVQKAIEEAELILFLCDGKEGSHPQDEIFAEKLRSRQKHVILVVNKIDHPQLYSNADQFYRLGYNHLVKVSAEQGQGIPELFDLIKQKLPESSGIKPEQYHFSLSIVGEPNSGKSTYFNALLNDDRAIVSEIPGTTRDTISEMIEYKNQLILLQDTAGLRPLRSNESPIQRFSMSRTHEAIRRSEVVLLIFDGYKGFGTVSKHIASFILECKKPCVVIVNKWDQIHQLEQSRYLKLIDQKVPFLSFFPKSFTSAKTKRNILEPLDHALTIYQKHIAHIKTHDLNEFLKKLKLSKTIKGNVKPKYLVQIRTAPPHFLLIGRHMNELKTPVVQFIKNEIRTTFKLMGTPLQLSIQEEKCR